MTDTPRITTAGVQVVGRFDQNSDPVRLSSAAGYVLSKRTSEMDTSRISPTVVPFVLHNWTSPLNVEYSWDTTIVTSQTDSEERRSLRDRPTKLVSYSASGVTANRLANMLDSLRTLTGERTLWPLLSDGGLVSGDNVGGVIPGDFAYRRLMPGQPLIVIRPSRDVPTVVSTALTVDSVSGNSLTVAQSPSGGTIQAGDIVYPAFYGEVNLSGATVDWRNDRVGEASFEVQEILGPSTTTPIAEANPGDFGVHSDGLPIFSISPNWTKGVTRKISRYGTVASLGRYPITDAIGERPKYAFSAEFQSMNRQEFYRLAQFFHWRKGRKDPFWFVSPDTLFEVFGTSVSSVDVYPFGASASGSSADIGPIAIVKTNGEVMIRNVVSTVQSDVWSLVLDEPIGNLVPAEIARVTTAHKCRFGSDAMEEQWVTDVHCSTRMEFVELLQEAVIDIDDYELSLTHPTPGGISDSPAFWMNANKHAYQDIGRYQEARDGDEVFLIDDARNSPSWPYMYADDPADLVQVGRSGQSMNGNQTLVFDSTEKYWIEASGSGVFSSGASNLGGTLFVVFRAPGTGVYTLFHATEGNFELSVAASGSTLAVQTEFSGGTTATTNLTLSVPTKTNVFAYVIDNTTRHKAFLNGSSAAMSASTIPLGSPPSSYYMAPNGISVGTVLLYSKPLSDADIETVANNLVQYYDADDVWDITP